MLLYMDGMGHYATDEIDKKYTAVTSTGATWTVAAEGRYNNCLKRVPVYGYSGSDAYVEIAPLMTQGGSWTPTASGVFGMALKVDDVTDITSGGSGAVQPFVNILDGNFRVCNFTLNQNGTFSAYSKANGAFGVNGILLGTSIQGIRSAVWAYVEFKWNISTTDGYMQVCVNEVPVLSVGITNERAGTPVTGTRVYGSDTNYGYNGYWTGLRYGMLGGGTGGVGTTARFGDVYLADLTGSGDEIRDYLGDITVDYIVPDGVGASSGWTPLSGANWTNVEEVPPDEDSTYVSATTIGTRDSYTFQNVPAGTVPVGFQTLVYARKATEGAASLQPTFRQAGVNYDSNTQGISTPDEYRYIIQPYDTNPATSATITESEINGAEFGVLKVT